MKKQPDPLEIYISRLEIQFFHGVGKVLEAFVSDFFRLPEKFSCLTFERRMMAV